MNARTSVPGLKDKPLVSVVIPAFNEEEHLPICLASLAAQETDTNFEVIVVDNNSTDNTSGVAKKFEKQLNLRIIKELKRGRGAARFTGFKYAAGSIIFSTDADTVVPENWIEEYLKKFKKDPSLVAVTGIPQIRDFDVLKNSVFNLTVPQFLKINYLAFGHPGLSGFSFAIKESAYDEAGGFDPVTDCYEDLDLAHSVHKVGKIALVTKPPVFFSGRRFEKGLLAGYSEYVKSFIDMFLLKKKRVVLSNPRGSVKAKKK